jgi:hypothetical protein
MEPRRTEFKCQGQHPLTRQQRERPGPLETLTDTLIERVDKLVEADKEPLLSTTGTSRAIRELFARTEALKNAVREIALEVQKLSAQGYSPSAPILQVRTKQACAPTLAQSHSLHHLTHK